MGIKTESVHNLGWSSVQQSPRYNIEVAPHLIRYFKRIPYKPIPVVDSVFPWSYKTGSPLACCWLETVFSSSSPYISVPFGELSPKLVVAGWSRLQSPKAWQLSSKAGQPGNSLLPAELLASTCPCLEDVPGPGGLTLSEGYL